MSIGRTTSIGVLIAASLFVALAILLDGQVSRTVNSVGGLLWLVAAVFLIRGLRGHDRFLPLLTLSTLLTLVLTFVTSPSDYLSASIGFAVAGAAIAFVARSHGTDWAATIPALWLPIHLVVALIRVAERTIRDIPATVRTDPPPTSAFVPFVMVVAAFAGGAVVREVRRQKVSGDSSHADAQSQTSYQANR